jgi:glycerol-3-phosphate dehydrogenase
MEDEVDFVLSNAQRYLDRAPTRADVLAVFTGHPSVSEERRRREYRGVVEGSHDPHRSLRVLTITGGQVDHVPHMAEDCVDHAATLGRLPERRVSRNRFASTGITRMLRDDWASMARMQTACEP